MRKLIYTLCSFLCITTINAQWHQVNSNTTAELIDLYMVNENIGYCVGKLNLTTNSEFKGIILKTTDGGENWEPCFENNGILSVYSIGKVANEITAIGANQNNRYLLKSTNGGDNWTVNNVEIGNWAEGIKILENAIYFTDVESQQKVLKKIENGVMTILANNVETFGVNNNEIVYADIHTNNLYKSEDYGQNFYILSSFPEGISSNNMQYKGIIKSFGDSIVVEWAYPNPGTTYSTDNGQNWILNYGNSPTDFCTIVSPNFLIGCNKNQRKVHTQTNFEPWEEEEITFSEKVNKVYVYNESLAFVIGENGMIYKTSNLLSNEQPFEKLSFKIIPNPSSDIFNIFNPDNLNITSIELFDLTGKKIKHFESKTQSINLSYLSSGTYILNISTKDYKHSEKIVKY